MFDIISFIPRAVVQGVPLLYGSTGEILTEKSGNLNLGIPGIMYVGGICGVIGSFFYENSLPSKADISALPAILIPIVCCLLGSLLMGLLYCLLTVTLRANQNVTGLAMTTFSVGVGNFFGGSLIKLSGSEVPSIALSGTSYFFHHPLFAESEGWFYQDFLSYGFMVYLAIAIGFFVAWFMKHTRTGLHLRAVGENPNTADAAIFGKPIPKRTRTDEERTKTTHDAPDPRDHRDGPVHHLLRLLHHDHHLVTDRPAGHVHQPAYRSRMRHHGDNPRPHPPHDNLHDHHPNERKGKTWDRQSCNRR